MDYGFEDLGSLSGGVKAFVHGALEVPFHWHDHLEILMVVRGSVRMIIDGQECLMGSDDLVIINAHSAHNSVSLDPGTVLCGVHIDVAHAERQGLVDFSKRYLQCKSFLTAKHFCDDVVAPMRGLIARLILSSGNVEDGLLRTCLAGLLCCHIYRHVPYVPRREAPSVNGDGRERVMRIMERMRAERDGRLSLEYFAEMEGLSIPHLSRLFRRHVGICFRDYAQNIRLDRAVSQLVESGQSIVDIALDEGFSSGSLFYAKFRERFGCTPAEYRRRRAEPQGEAGSAHPYRHLLMELAERDDGLSRQLMRLPESRELVAVCALHASGMG
ncbi:hypothetical protein CLG96_16550 [Sphingomonas oleivorans]|uniref:HTH araC/xylS-type domain-containing protein n=1 Tax=Sphingomonas oleivorans TaxID=1735121 RepID=A0A2T5FU03_9SPHN|nr:AraC family transcriptional regulator [Sphingomonas oleivorans]PTQ07762.1 hypothetical protein CLG96_16550 [Sphingomonas oleivorans]